MTYIAKQIEKFCPWCSARNKAYEAEVLPHGDIVYRFLCSFCNIKHVKVVEAPNVTVEPLVGFKSKPMRWVQ